jgi:hypothetical protein
LQSARYLAKAQEDFNNNVDFDIITTTLPPYLMELILLVQAMPAAIQK